MNARQPVVLVADDDPDIRQLVRLRLERSGYVRVRDLPGMDTLWSDGMAKVEAGLISREELHRVVPH
jgi:CheY-like chemotaxis protein